MKHFVLMIESGVDADVRGPFSTAQKRDDEARKLVHLSGFNQDYDSIFRMDVENDKPEAYSFSHDELYGTGGHSKR